MIESMVKLKAFLKDIFIGKAPAWFYVMLISLVYVVLQSGSFALLIPEAGHDDRLQLRLSESLSKGHWLGTYNNLTLAKGIAYPAWTAMLHTADIPLWLGNAVLLALACLCMVLAIKPLVNNKWLLIFLYTILLFNPLITPREYRDSITPAIALFVIAWVVGLFVTVTELVKIKDKVKSRVYDRWIKIYAVIGSISLPFWWFIREDYFWVLPFVISALLASLIAIAYAYKKRNTGTRQLGLVLLAAILPFLITLASGLIIATINKQEYGRFVVNDYMSHDFQAAYGALMRIKDDARPITVPVSRSMREKAYSVSPAFKELRPCLDESGPSGCGGFILNVRVRGDYEGGWFFWAVRDAVQKQGYYLNAATAEQYYVRLANEINSACDTGKLVCDQGKQASLFAPFTKKTILPTLSKIPQAVSYIATLQGLEEVRATRHAEYSPDKEAMADYYGVRYSSGEVNVGVRIKDKLLAFIGFIYKIINPILFVSALGLLLWFTIGLKNSSRYWREVLISWGLLMLMATRVFLITYVDVTSFPAIGTIYFSSLYPIMFLFEGMLVIILIKTLGDVRYRKAKN